LDGRYEEGQGKAQKEPKARKKKNWEVNLSWGKGIQDGIEGKNKRSLGLKERRGKKKKQGIKWAVE